MRPHDPNQRLKLRSGDGLLDAELSIASVDSQGFVIILESAGGATGERRLRNSDYSDALAEILRRCAPIADSVEDCLLSSRPTRGLPESDRRIPPASPFSYPIPLDPRADFEKMRLALTSPQGHVASHAKRGGGNERKRISIRFKAKETHLTPSQILEALDAAPSDTPKRDRKDIATGLTRADVDAALAEWQRLGQADFHRRFGTSRAAKFVIADPDGTEYDAKAILFAARSLAGLDGVNSDFDGDRHTVLEPLEGLGYVVEDASVVDTQATDDRKPHDLDLSRALQQAKDFAGHTDALAERRVRREQRLLRRALGLGNGEHVCALCGRSYPDRLLVAAHIKRRSECTQEERIDIPAIAMVACAFGCDALFEFGYVFVNDQGIVESNLRADETGPVRDRAHALHGNEVSGYNSASAPYFEWHRSRL